MKPGDTLSWTRTFTGEDIRDFARLSGDAGTHHLQPDAQGRLMAHGLLTRRCQPRLVAILISLRAS
jgi:acyl dehydratase